MPLWPHIVAQFKKPHGLLGRLAGVIMANRPSNLRRNLWTVGLLKGELDCEILEIGCGPGLALEACLETYLHSRVIGIDHSPVMIEQAVKRLSLTVGASRVELHCAGLEWLSSSERRFDRIFSVNVVQFFSDITAGFRQIHGGLKSGGMALTTYQPRSRNPSREEAVEMARRVEEAMRAAGFENIERQELPLSPAPAICVTGKRQ